MFKNNNLLKINLNLYKSILQNQKNLKIQNRNMLILSEFVDKIVFIYNGKTYKKIKITSDMIGTKFGEYVFTRKKCVHKVKSLKKKKKK